MRRTSGKKFAAYLLVGWVILGSGEVFNPAPASNIPSGREAFARRAQRASVSIARGQWKPIAYSVAAMTCSVWQLEPVFATCQEGYCSDRRICCRYQIDCLL